jgi:epoxyqueuosine reductase
MPDWLQPDVHHALIGCMRCQEVCPANKNVPAYDKGVIMLNETESEAFLAQDKEKMPPELIKKLMDYGWVSEKFLPVAGRNARLLLDAVVPSDCD